MSDVSEKRRKLNNKGYSLVEILIAVMILAIATGPILSCFITSFRITGKSKERQRENSAAQSVMEGFKAYSMEELEKQFLGLEPLRIYNTANVVDAYGNTVQSLDHYSCDLKNSSGATTTDLKEVNNTQTIKPQEFFLYGVNYQGANFDIKISVSPDKDRAPSVTKNITYIENINGFQDCIYEQPFDEMGTNYYKLLTSICSELNHLDKVYGYDDEIAPGIPRDPTAGYRVSTLDTSRITMHREMTVTIGKTGMVETVKVKTDYKAYVDHFPYIDINGNTKYLTKWYTETVPEKVAYDNTDTHATLENVFLFVFPAYSSSLAIYPFETDKFKINAPSGDAKKVYFVKQKDNTALNLTTCENAYNPSFALTNIEFYHNLSDNLGGGLTTGAASFSSVGSTIQDGLAFEKPQTFIYKVYVELFEAGATMTDGTGLYHLEGTKNDK